MDMEHQKADDDVSKMESDEEDDVSKMESDEEDESESMQEYYEWNMTPISYPEDKQTGITFKGNTEEYYEASKKIKNMMNIKGMKYVVNDREIKIVDNADPKPIKVEVKPKKGPSGKVNVNIFGINKQGISTIVISKMSGGTMVHVKTVAFKVVKYLLDGMIDGEIAADDLENMKCSQKVKNGKNSLQCTICNKTFNSSIGVKIHITKQHRNEKKKVCQHCNLTFITLERLEEHASRCRLKHICKKCQEKFDNETSLRNHIQEKHDTKTNFNCDVCDYKTKRENDFKRHNRDKHDKTTCSTSPKPKKRKKDVTEEDMETAEFDIKTIHNKDLTKERKDYWIDAREDTNNKDVEMKTCDEKRKEHTSMLKPYLKELSPAIKELIGEGFVLFPIVGDGACAPRCVAAWVYEDQSLGPNLARNMNQLFVKHWYFWADKFNYPFIRNIGLGQEIICENEEQLLRFFMNSEKGAFMWRGHEDFVVIANAYQIKITLIKVHGLEDKNPEKIEIEPNPDFAKYAEVLPGKVLDMIILYEENVHYSLIIPQDCRLAENGSLDYQRAENVKNVEKVSGKEVNSESINKISMQGDSDQSEGNVEKVIGEIRTTKVTSINKLNGSKIVEKFKAPPKIRINTKEMSTQTEQPLDADFVHTLTGENVRKKSTEKNDMQDYENLEKRISSLEKSMRLILDRCSSLENDKFLNEKDHVNENQIEMEYDEFDDKMDEINNEEIIQKQKKRGFKRKGHNNKEESIENKDPQEIIEDDCKDETVLFNLKKSGFKRLSPQIQSEKKSNKIQYNCEKCNYITESQDLIESHRQNHTDQVYKCETCDETFVIQIQLDMHINEEHGKGKEKRKLKQYNCQDCAFQGEKGIELKKHIANTGHTPIECKEDCFNCGKEFPSYYQLMKHRNREHPSQKICRYFESNTCMFEADVCWYRHDLKSQQLQANKEVDCNKCSLKFESNQDMMMHAKKMHEMSVQRCRNYLQGTCEFTEDTCWYRHKDEKDVDEQRNVENLGFQKAQEKIPPDHIDQLIAIIQNWALHVQGMKTH